VAQYDFCFFQNKIKTANISFPGMSLKLGTIADRLERIPKCQFRAVNPDVTEKLDPRHKLGRRFILTL
jgi:hypothetical protein